MLISFVMLSWKLPGCRIHPGPTTMAKMEVQLMPFAIPEGILVDTQPQIMTYFV
jgi:hypothetical protein